MVTDPAEINRLSYTLMNTARRDFISLENDVWTHRSTSPRRACAERVEAELRDAGDRLLAVEEASDAEVRAVYDVNVDVEIAQDVLFGSIIFRLVSGHAPLTPTEADAALTGLFAQGGQRGSST